MQKLRKRMVDTKGKNNASEDLFDSEERKMDADGKSFEAVLKRLEKIVEKMESGGLGLEESMKLYEEGTKKIDILTSMLAEAREKVMKLVTNNEGKSSLEVFGGEDSD